MVRVALGLSAELCPNSALKTAGLSFIIYWKN